MDKVLLYIFDETECISWSQMKSKGVSTVFISYNLCESFFIHSDFNHLEEEMKKMRAAELETLISIPPVHERNMRCIERILQRLCRNETVTGFVVNDIGLLLKIREQFQWQGKLHFGRLFDKTVREARFDFTQENNYGRVLKMEVNDLLLKTAEQYCVSGMVIDTMPDGILDLRDIDGLFKIYLIYPKIILSKAAYCEISGYQKNMDAKFLLDEQCNKPCLLYRKRIAATHPIWKEGLLIFCTQACPVHECAIGNYTVVASKEYWNECDCTY